MDNDSNNILLSFCIPTYRRAELVRECCKRILAYQGDEIELVVIDNASPDGTQDRIRSLDDSRISYYRNESNIGAVANMVETVRKARGKWVYTLSDEDIVEKEAITNIIQELSKPAHDATAVILGNVRRTKGGYYVFFRGGSWVPYHYENKRYTKGNEAVSSVGFHHKYMSGILIQKQFITEEDLNRFAKTNGGSPLTGIYSQACSRGDAVTIDCDVCVKNDKGGEKSYVETTNTQSYRHPLNRTEQFKIYSTLANEILKTDAAKKHVLLELYEYYLDSCTNEWESCSKDPEKVAFYGVGGSTNRDYSNNARNFHSAALTHFRSIVDSPELLVALEKETGDGYKHLIRDRNPQRLKSIVRTIKRRVKKLLGRR